MTFLGKLTYVSWLCYVDGYCWLWCYVDGYVMLMFVGYVDAMLLSVMLCWCCLMVIVGYVMLMLFHGYVVSRFCIVDGCVVDVNGYMVWCYVIVGYFMLMLFHG